MNPISYLREQSISTLLLTDQFSTQKFEQALVDLYHHPDKQDRLKHVVAFIDRVRCLDLGDQASAKECIEDFDITTDPSIKMVKIFLELFICHKEMGEKFFEYLKILSEGDDQESARAFYSKLEAVNRIFQEEMLADNIEIYKNINALSVNVFKSLNSFSLSMDSLKLFGLFVKASGNIFCTNLPEYIENDPMYLGKYLLEGCCTFSDFIVNHQGFIPVDISVAMQEMCQQMLRKYAKTHFLYNGLEEVSFVIVRPTMVFNTLIQDSFVVEKLSFNAEGASALETLVCRYSGNKAFNLEKLIRKKIKFGKKVVFLNLERTDVEKICNSYCNSHLAAEHLMAQLECLCWQQFDQLELLSVVCDFVDQVLKHDPFQQDFIIEKILKNISGNEAVVAILIKKILVIINAHQIIGETFFKHIRLIALNKQDEAARHLYQALTTIQSCLKQGMMISRRALGCLGEELLSCLKDTVDVFNDTTFDQLIATSSYILDNVLHQEIKDCQYFFGETLIEAYEIGSTIVKDFDVIPVDIRRASTNVCRAILKKYFEENVGNDPNTAVCLVRPSSSQYSIQTENNMIVLEYVYVVDGKMEGSSLQVPYSIDKNKNTPYFGKNKDNLRTFIKRHLVTSKLMTSRDINIKTIHRVLRSEVRDFQSIVTNIYAPPED